MVKIKHLFSKLLPISDKKILCPEERVTRYLCYQDITHWLTVQGKRIEGNVLCISGVPPFINQNNPKIFLTKTSYPEIDFMKLPYSDRSFDWVISDQVLEHVKNPWLAMQECHRVLKREGMAIHTSVSFYMHHGGPNDYWRFMPDGLKELCSMFSKIRHCHSWGSKEAVS